MDYFPSYDISGYTQVPESYKGWTYVLDTPFSPFDEQIFGFKGGIPLYSLTPWNEENPGRLQWVKPDSGGLIDAAASVFSGGLHDIVKGDAPGTGLGNFAPVMNIINPAFFKDIR